MTKLISAVMTAALLGAGATAFAKDNMAYRPMMDGKMMDANGDGMISKDEYMNYHESMWMKMKKNKDGMVMMKDMGMMGGSAPKEDTNMERGPGKDGKMMDKGTMKSGG